MPGAATSTGDSDRRPTLLLLVYCWDLLLAILAVFGALAALGGGLQVGVGTKAYPLALQIIAAVSSASYAAVLAILASLLTRRQRWIRRLQIAVLAAAVGLALLSLLVVQLTGGGITVGPLLVLLLFLLIDGAAILVMTEQRVASWYTEPAPMPWYAYGTFGFWALTQLLLLALDAVV